MSIYKFYIKENKNVIIRVLGVPQLVEYNIKKQKILYIDGKIYIKNT